MILSSIMLPLTLTTWIGPKKTSEVYLGGQILNRAKKGTFYTRAQAFNNLTPYLKEVDSVYSDF